MLPVENPVLNYVLFTITTQPGTLYEKKGRKKSISLTNCDFFQLHAWTLLVPYFFMSVYPSSQTEKVIPTLWTWSLVLSSYYVKNPFFSDEVFRHPTKAGKVHQNFFGLFWFFYYRWGLHIAKIRFLEDQPSRGMTHYVTVRRKKSQKLNIRSKKHY